MRIRLGLLLAIVVTVASCRAESVTRVTIEPDGASVDNEVAFDEEALDLIGTSDATDDQVLQSMAALIQPTDPRTTEELFTRDGLSGLRLRTTGLDYSEVEPLITAGSSVIGDFTIVADGERIEVAGRTRPITAEERAELERQTLEGDLTEIFSLTLEVALPGELVDHNADGATGGVLMWDLLPAVTEGTTVEFSAAALAAEVTGTSGAPGAAPIEPSAETVSEESEGLRWTWVVVPMLVAGAGFLVVLVRRTRRES